MLNHARAFAENKVGEKSCLCKNASIRARSGATNRRKKIQPLNEALLALWHKDARQLPFKISYGLVVFLKIGASLGPPVQTKKPTSHLSEGIKYLLKSLFI